MPSTSWPIAKHSQLSHRARGFVERAPAFSLAAPASACNTGYELYSPISGSRMPVQMMIADRTLDPPRRFRFRAYRRASRRAIWGG